MSKELGQVAYEVFWEGVGYNPPEWDQVDASRKTAWEASAQAVIDFRVIQLIEQFNKAATPNPDPAPRDMADMESTYVASDEVKPCDQHMMGAPGMICLLPLGHSGDHIFREYADDRTTIFAKRCAHTVLDLPDTQRCVYPEGHRGAHGYE